MTPRELLRRCKSFTSTQVAAAILGGGSSRCSRTGNTAITNAAHSFSNTFPSPYSTQPLTVSPPNRSRTTSTATASRRFHRISDRVSPPDVFFALQAPLRQYSSGNASSGGSASNGSSGPMLSDVLKREMDEEAHRAGKPTEPAPPAGWRVERTGGHSTFSLHREFEDEKILVRYTPTENTDVNYHELTAFISRKGKCLVIEVSVEEGELVLNGISFFHDEALAKDMSAESDVTRAKLYPGPKLSELDDTIMDHFIRYLEERGINSELGEFVSLYSFWAEQQEFEGWLHSIQEFVS